MRIIIDPADEIDLEIADDQEIDMRTESDLQTDGGAEAESEIFVTGETTLMMGLEDATRTLLTHGREIEVIIVGKSQADQRA